jgi:putative transposase
VPVLRTRRLPHYHAVNQPIFLTWRLLGSLPEGRIFPAATTSGRAFVAMDRLLDSASTGPLHLRRPEIAKMVVETIYYHDQTLKHYQLHNFVVMANHVHLLITPRVPVSKLLQSLKRFTAREGNRILGVTGQPFWQDESYDRLVRDAIEFERIANYIETNPVSAGVAAAPADFLWSSGRRIANPPQVTNLPHIESSF